MRIPAGIIAPKHGGDAWNAAHADALAAGIPQVCEDPVVYGWALPMRHPAAALELDPLVRCNCEGRIAILEASRARGLAVQPELQLGALILCNQDGVDVIVQFSQPPESNHLI